MVALQDRRGLQSDGDLYQHIVLRMPVVKTGACSGKRVGRFGGGACTGHCLEDVCRYEVQGPVQETI